jgi:hypothetical protein
MARVADSHSVSDISPLVWLRTEIIMIKYDGRSIYLMSRINLPPFGFIFELISVCDRTYQVRSELTLFNRSSKILANLSLPSLSSFEELNPSACPFVTEQN